MVLQRSEPQESFRHASLGSALLPEKRLKGRDPAGGDNKRPIAEGKHLQLPLKVLVPNAHVAGSRHPSRFLQLGVVPG